MNAEISIPFITVFIQGLLSFFSPCVLPLIPVYLAVLSGQGSQPALETAPASRVRTMRNTFFFVLGISFAFFVLGMGMSALGVFLRTRQLLFVRIGGLLIILFGLYQLGVFGRSQALEQERRLPLRLERMRMSPLVALLMGFVFSFAWTPCVGPTLSSVLLMAATAQTRATGLLLIGVYTLGFVLPFLAVGLFTTSLLALLQRHRGVVKYTVKAGAILMILLGVLMITGKMNAITGYLSAAGGIPGAAASSDEETAAVESGEETKEDVSDTTDPGAKAEEEIPDTTDPGAETAEIEGTSDATSAPAEEETGEETREEVYPAPDFELADQFGNIHTLADYKGKVIFLNFWGTWCPPCRMEMPAIQALYEKYGEDDPDVAVLGVTFPGTGRERSKEEIADFLSENGYTYPTLMDTSAGLMYQYGITAYPTTFMIDRGGNIYGYVSGALSEEMMESIIQQTLALPEE